MDNKTKPEPLRFRQVEEPIGLPHMIERTASYAADPTTYMESLLEEDVFNERKHLLCIPTPDLEVDKDIYGSGKHMAHFQEFIARLFGKGAGLFFLTGVQAQLAALKIQCLRASNNRVAWHVSSHLEDAEERAYSELYGLERRLIGSREDENPTVAEIKEVLSLPPEQRPAVVLLELPNRVLGCKTYTFAELVEIFFACKQARVKLHLDGARIWEIEPFYAHSASKTFADIARLFDTVYVSFYKALQGVAGAMLLGDEQLIEEAKIWRRRAGGNAVTLMYEVIDCERGYNENIGTFQRKWEKMVEVAEAISAATEKFRAADGARIVSFMAEPTTCCQVRTVYHGFSTEELTAARDKVQEEMNVRMFDRVNSKLTLDERNRAERDGKVDMNGDTGRRKHLDGTRHEVEWWIGKGLLDVETKVFVDAFVMLCDELIAGGKG